METKLKVSEVTLYKENAFKGNDSYNVKMEGDDRRFSYLCQGAPKIKVGDTGPFILKSDTGANGQVWWKISLPKEDFPAKRGGGGWKPKANNLMALEWARKMFNSSQETEDKWSLENMLSTATYLKKRLDEGTNRDAIEAATIIACATAMGQVSMDAKVLIANIAKIEEWIEKSK